MIPPIEPIMVEVIGTTPYSAEISWVIPYVVLDKETYTVHHSTDMLLQNSSEVVIENNMEYVINQKFSINITGLIPFTTYYYIIQANNSVGNTSTDVMNFTTNQTGMNKHNIIIKYSSHGDGIVIIYTYVQLLVWLQVISKLLT